MSDDESPRFSAFWPMAILLAAFAISFIYQIVELVSHRNAVNREYTQAAQSIPKAQAAQDRLVALIKDLAKAAPKDANAMQVMRLSAQSGIIRERAPTSTPASGATNAAPANP
jgi:hypothetical protein